MDFAMVLNSTVIDVVKNVNEAPEYPPTISGETITAIECTGITVNVGMIYKDGVFSEQEKPTPEPKPTDQEIINASLMATMNEILLKLSGGETSV